MTTEKLYEFGTMPLNVARLIVRQPAKHCSENITEACGTIMAAMWVDMEDIHLAIKATT